MHLMISRVEGIGDVCLTLPAIGYVKQLMPECKISMLVSPYSQAVARSCHWLDDVVVLEPNQPVSDIASFLTSLHISHFVHVTANKTLAKAAKMARIMHRVGLAGRHYHWLSCTQLLWMSRAKSGFHEAYFNLLFLARSLGLTETNYDTMRQNLVEWSGFSPSPNLFDEVNTPVQVLLHPYSRGHGREWPISQFAELAEKLIARGMKPVIGGTSADFQSFQRAQHLFPDSCQLVFGQDSLDAYLKRIANSGALVASGTGPLHIASVMGQRCVGIFPPRKVVNSRRWGALGPLSRNLELSSACQKECSNTECECMAKISADMVINALTELLQTQQLHTNTVS